MLIVENVLTLGNDFSKDKLQDVKKEKYHVNIRGTHAMQGELACLKSCTNVYWSYSPEATVPHCEGGAGVAPHLQDTGHCCEWRGCDLSPGTSNLWAIF